MKFMDVLPDEWGKIAKDRYRVFCRETLKNRDNIEFLFEECMECGGVRILNAPQRTFVRCIFNKCIKEYPHRIDNREFK